MTSAATATGFTFGFHYQIPGSALVTDRAQAARGDGAAGPVARTAFARLPQPGAVLVADNPLLQVFMNATVTETSKAVFDEYVDKMSTFLKAEGTLDQFVQGLKAVGSIFEAEDLSAEDKKYPTHRRA